MKLTFKIVLLSLILIQSTTRASAFDGYPQPDKMYKEIYDLRNELSGLVEVGEYGRSVEDRPLLYIKISPGDEFGTASSEHQRKPAAFIAGNIHGNEWIGNRVAMEVARRLASGYLTDDWIKSVIDKFDIYILPCINPDGYARTWALRDDEKAVWADMRKNAHGVDLNRNFPLPGKRTMSIGMAGSDKPGDTHYTGPRSYSEPETVAIKSFIESHSFFASIDLHSSWATFFPPKCNGKACEKQFHKMMEAAQEKQPHVKYQIVQQWQVDTFTGEMEDALFYDYGIMAVCWEVMPVSVGYEQQTDPRYTHSFWGANPVDVNYWLENDVDAVIAALEKAFELTGGAPVPEKLRQVKE